MSTRDQTLAGAGEKTVLTGATPLAMSSRGSSDMLVSDSTSPAAHRL